MSPTLDDDDGTGGLRTYPSTPYSEDGDTSYQFDPHDVESSVICSCVLGVGLNGIALAHKERCAACLKLSMGLSDLIVGLWSPALETVEC